MSVLDIRVQKLFAVTLALKVGSSFLGWLLGDPWILGFTVPLLFMVTYIVLGSYRHDNEVTDEKFADSCYYLGFIFTITSIIFSLFDLPQIGARIQDIAVRFGAAMVSTVLGLGVRVYLVSFKKEMADAIKDAEDAVIDATRKFTEQLAIVLERLGDFESQVDTAAKESVERVKIQVESLSRSHADKLNGFFEKLTIRNEKALTSALAAVEAASERLEKAVDGYSEGMRTNLTSIESRVVAFADAVTDRLRTTTFPDDYFAEHLKGPLAQLHEGSTAIANGIKASQQEVSKSATVLSTALKKLQDKASAAETSLETVLKLTQQQQAVLDSANEQLSVLEQLGTRLTRFDDALGATLASVKESNSLTSDLTTRIADIVSDGAEIRRALETALAGITGTLKAQLNSTDNVVTTLEAGAAVTRVAAKDLADKLDASVSATIAATADASTTVTAKLDAVAAAELEMAQTLRALGQQSTAALGRVDEAVKQLQGMVHQLAGLDAAFRSFGSELRDAVGRVEAGRAIDMVPAGAREQTLDLPPGALAPSPGMDAPAGGPRLPASVGAGGQSIPGARSSPDANLVAGADASTSERMPDVSSPPASGSDSALSGPVSELAQQYPAKPFGH